MELERLELSSKRGTNLLSTCLSSLRFSEQGKTEATNLELILFISSAAQDVLQTISEIAVPPDRIASKTELPGDISFLYLVKE